MSDRLQFSPIPATATEPLLNEREAAAFLNVSRMTLLRWRQAGKIKFYRLGFRVVYSKHQLQEFLAAREVNTTNLPEAA